MKMDMKDQVVILTFGYSFICITEQKCHQPLVLHVRSLQPSRCVDTKSPCRPEVAVTAGDYSKCTAVCVAVNRVSRS